MQTVIGRGDRSARGLLGGLSARPVPTPILGLLAALLSWNLGFAVPQAGVDPSWSAGLYMAVRQGLDFGTEIVFTYGPTGFLRMPGLWYSDLAAISFAYSAIVHVGMACGLVWALRDRFGPLAAFAGTFLIMACVPLLDPVLGLALIWSYALLSGRASGGGAEVAAVAAGALAGIEILGKLSTGPVILVVLVLGMAGARSSKRSWAAFGGAFAISASASWLLTGQGVGSLPEFARHTFEIVAGYNEAMGSTGTTWAMVAGPAVLAAGTAVWAWFGRYVDRRARIAGTAAAAIVCFAAYKQAVVRTDEAHGAVFLATMVFLWLAVPPAPGLRWVSGGAVAAIASAAAIALPGAPKAGLDPVDNVKAAYESTRTLVDSDWRQVRVGYAHFNMVIYYGFGPEVLRAVASQRVSVAGAEAAAAWAHGLEWDPPPVFQDYSAYTPALDRLNADSIASADGPQRILVQNPAAFDPELGAGLPYRVSGVGERYPGWDPPLQALETVCRFVPEVANERWQVLARTPDRCGSERPAGTVEAGPGERIPVPEPGPREIVYAKVQGLGVGGLESLRSLLYKPAARYGEMEDGTRFRLPPGLAEDGLLLRAGRGVGSSRPPYGLIPQTSSLAMLGASGDLRYEFFRLRVRPAGRAAAPSGG